MARFLTDSVKRFQRGDHIFLTHADLRRCFTEGSSSIYMNLPVPRGVSGGKAFDNFAIVSVEQAVNHILGHGFPLKTLKLNKMSDWKTSNLKFHTLFHKELYDKILKFENIPENLRIHLLYIWSDGFQKNTLVKTKKHLCNYLLCMLSLPMAFVTLQNTHSHLP